MARGAGAAIPLRHRDTAEVSLPRNPRHTNRDQRKLASKIESDLPSVKGSDYVRREVGRKCGKRTVETASLPGGCPRGVITYSDVEPTKRFQRFSRKGTSAIFRLDAR